jgi:hypothetical protein
MKRFRWFSSLVTNSMKSRAVAWCVEQLEMPRFQRPSALGPGSGATPNTPATGERESASCE